MWSTEYGMVNLKGMSVPERAKALISIAHPDFREELSRQAREAESGAALGLVMAGTRLPRGTGAVGDAHAVAAGEAQRLHQRHAAALRDALARRGGG